MVLAPLSCTMDGLNRPHISSRSSFHVLFYSYIKHSEVGGGAFEAKTTPPLNNTRLRLFNLVPSCLLSFTHLLTPSWGRCESMPSAAPSTWRYYVVVREMWTPESVRGSRRCQNPFSLSSGGYNGVILFYPTTTTTTTMPPFIFVFSLFYFCSHRDTAEKIEVVASRAANASKQALGLLMDLLQDNSTEEYIRNLTER